MGGAKPWEAGLRAGFAKLRKPKGSKIFLDKGAGLPA